MYRITGIIILLLCTGFLQAANLPDFPFVVSTGKAEKKVRPDNAEVSIRLLSFEKESDKSLSSMNAASESVLKILGKYKIDIKKLEASDIEKNTKRERDENYNYLEILGYEVSRRMTLKLDDLSIYPELMNDLIAINNITSIDTSFDVTNRDTLETELIRQASQNAMSKAKKMANSLGTKIHSVYAVSQASGFGDFFATFGAQSYDTRAYAMKSRSSSQLRMFVPEKVNVSQRINVVFRLK